MTLVFNPFTGRLDEIGQPAGVPIPGGQNSADLVQGDGSPGNPLRGNINGLPQETSIQESIDFVVVYDVSAGIHVKALISDLVPGALQLIGEIANANTNPGFPAAPNVGDVWIITTTAGTVGGVTVEIGDQLIYSASGWFVVQTNITEATQAEMEAGTAIGYKFASPTTTNPANYTNHSGIFTAGDRLRMWSNNDNAVVGVDPQDIADLKAVIMPPTAARVTPNGDDATGMVGRFDRPFLTPEAAEAAVPFGGSVFIEKGTYSVNWTIGNVKSIYLSSVLIDGTINLGLINQIVSLPTNDLQNSQIYFCTINNAGFTGSYISGVAFETVNINGAGLNLYDIPYLNYSGYFVALNNSLPTIISFSGEANGVGTMLNYTGAATSGPEVTVKGSMTSSGLGTLIDFNDCTNGLLTIEDCGKVVTTSDTIQSSLTGVRTANVVAYNTSFKTTGYFVNNSTSGGNMNITLRRASEIDSAQTQNIAWSTSPANKVTLKTTPGTLSTKVWDALGIVNVGASTDYTTVDATLTI